MLRFLLWRLLGLLAFVVSCALAAWCLDGGLGSSLRGRPPHVTAGHVVASSLATVRRVLIEGAAVAGAPIKAAAAVSLGLGVLLCIARSIERSRRSYVRLRIEAHRTDQATAEAVVMMFAALHKRLLRRWWRRAALGQPAVALEVHHDIDTRPDGGQTNSVWMAICCPSGSERMMEAALRTAYPNLRLTALAKPAHSPASLLRLKKDGEFIKRVKSLEHFEHEREPAINRLLTVMSAGRRTVLLQLAITPAPVAFERFARRMFKLHEQRLSRERRAHLVTRDRSMVDDAELRGGLEVQDQPSSARRAPHARPRGSRTALGHAGVRPAHRL